MSSDASTDGDLDVEEGVDLIGGTGSRFCRLASIVPLIQLYHML